MDEMCRYEGKTEKSERIYTYEKAVERYDNTTLPRQAQRTIIYATYFDFEVTICPKMVSVTAGKCLSAPECDAHAGERINSLYQPITIQLN